MRPGRLAEWFRRNNNSRPIRPALTIEDSLTLAASATETLNRAFKTGDQAGLDEGINLIQRVRAVQVHDHPDWPVYLSILGNAMLYRYGRTGRTEDLDGAVGAFRDAAGATSADHPGRSMILSNLGVALLSRFDRSFRLEDLDEAIAAFQEVARAVPEGHPDRRECLSMLGTALLRRFERVGRPEDLDGAVGAYREVAEVAEATPADHPERPKILFNLGRTLQDEYERTGRKQYLDEAVFICRLAVEATPEDHPDRPGYLSTLGTALQDRASRTGRTEDMDGAVKAYRQAVQSTLITDPYRPGYLSNLGTVLRDRYGRTGRTEDLYEAVEVCREAVDATPAEDPRRPERVSNLGAALSDLSERTGWIDDLNGAVDAFRQAAGSVPAEDLNRAMYLSNLGAVLRNRYGRTGRTEDLDGAVEVCRQAVMATPAADPKWPGRLSNFGTVLLDRYWLTGRTEDLDQALEAGHQAVAYALDDHPERPARLFALGTALRTLFDRYGRGEDLKEAVEVFRLAAGVVSAPAHVRVRAAREWGRSAALGENWTQAAEAYGEAVDLAGLVASAELGRADQEHHLGEFSGLGSEAAAACLQAGQPGRAVELFEQGRAVLFSRVLDARSDLTGLHEAYPDLAERFVRMRDVLDRPDPGMDGLSSSGAGRGPDLSRLATERRQEAAAGLEEVLGEIRSRPGFERFLLARTAEELLPAAGDGPVVLLNVDFLRSDALILSEGGVRVVSLQGVGPEEVRRQVIAFLAALDTGSESALAGVLEWLGERITGPVLDHLGYTAAPAPGMPWPRVWWCPSGALALLPLHAAGRHEVSDGPPAVIDQVISSTVPTVRALLRARQAPPPVSEPRMLLVAMPVTPGQADLPAVYRESDTLQKLYLGRVDVLGLPGTDPADYDNVMAALPGHPMVHFACHGESDLSDPSSSHLLLNDYPTRPLTVLELTGARLQGAEMAFLSACTTARTGSALPDEPIHLAAACQLAGYRHVIASLWPIGDADTAALTKDFYTTLINHPRDVNAAADALHHATRRLRLIYRDRPSHWAPYTHTGP